MVNPSTLTRSHVHKNQTDWNDLRYRNQASTWLNDEGKLGGESGPARSGLENIGSDFGPAIWSGNQYSISGEPLGIVYNTKNGLAYELERLWPEYRNSIMTLTGRSHGLVWTRMVAVLTQRCWPAAGELSINFTLTGANIKAIVADEIKGYIWLGITRMALQPFSGEARQMLGQWRFALCRSDRSQHPAVWQYRYSKDGQK